MSHPIHQFVHAPEPLRWLTSLSPLAVLIVLLLALPVGMFILNGLFSGAWAYPHWHAFAWGDGLALPLLGFFVTFARDAWNGGNKWYVSRWWFFGWIIAGLVVTALNAYNDYLDNDRNWHKVVNNGFAVYHIVLIAVVFAGIGCMSGAAIVAHVPTWVGLGIGLSLAVYVASVVWDIIDKKFRGKRGGYDDAAFPAADADTEPEPAATDESEADAAA